MFPIKQTFFIVLAFLVHSLQAKNEQASDVNFPQGNWFVENKGQICDQEKRPVNSVLYQMEQPGISIYLTNSGLTYLFIKPKKEKEENENENEIFEYKYERFDLELSGIKIQKEQIIADRPTAHTMNFYLGKPGCIVENLRGYEHLLIRNIYPGIDWSLYASNGGTGLKYDFIVHPGADPSLIKLLYRGKSPVDFPDEKTMRIRTGIGSLTDRVPLAYCGDEKKNVPVHYTVFSNIKKQHLLNRWNETEISFSLGNYDSTSTLVIDPAQLWWGTYFGGNFGARGHSVACDYNGNLDFLGDLSQATFPVFNPGNNAYFQGTSAGFDESVIAQFNSNGVLTWSTYFSGSLSDRMKKIGVMPNNDMVVCGTTNSTDFVTFNPGNGAYFQPVMAGNYDGLIARFSSTGVMNWSTYWGNSNFDTFESLAIDAQGNLFITGTVYSGNVYPLTSPGNGAYQQNFSSAIDAFVMRFSPQGAINWFTYFGGSMAELGSEITVSPTGEIAIMGITSSTDLPVVSPAQFNDFYQPVNGGGNNDIFLARFSPTCALQWCTYLGGINAESEMNLLFDNQTNLLVTGVTNSPGFPYVNPGNGAYFSNTGSGFIASFNDSLELKWCTKIELNGNIGKGFGMAIGSCNQIYLGGMPGQNPPVLDPGGGAYYLNTLQGGIDIFIMEFNSSYQLQWGTYWGGYGTDDGICFALDQSGAMYATGDAGGLVYNISTVGTFQTNCLLNPGGGAYYQNLPGNYIDYPYVTKFTPTFNSTAALSATILATNPTCPGFNDGSIILSPSGGQPSYSVEWLPGNFSDTVITNLSPGNYFYTLQDSAGCTIHGTVALQSNNYFDIQLFTSSADICIGDSAIIIASGAPSVVWSPAVGNGDTLVVSPAISTTYFASYTDSSGCVSSDSITIHLVTANVSITGDSLICNGSAATINASGNGVISWLNLNTASNPYSFPFPNDTVIYAVSTVSASCTDTNSFHISVLPSPQVWITGQDTVCDSTNIAVFTVTPCTAQWSTGANGNSIQVMQSGLYTVTVTDQNGCQGTASMYITVIDCGPGMISENSMADFSVSPNPASENINIVLPAGKIWQLEVIDARGRIILHSNVQGPNTILYSSEWADGIYLLRFSTEQEIHELKLVKEAEK